MQDVISPLTFSLEQVKAESSIDEAFEVRAQKESVSELIVDRRVMMQARKVLCTFVNGTIDRAIFQDNR